ncbi:MAG: phosphodiester glycosidase family protein [Pseudonocardiaceae bacterium]|nr:phosphodiester glycosidase family protein [Pseudonocardiaceae bacterium]
MSSAKFARRYAAIGAVVLLSVLVPPAASAVGSGEATHGIAAEEVAPGVSYQKVEKSTSNGSVVAHLLTVDLSNPDTGLDLLYPDAVAAANEVSDMADAQHAVAGINADFFNLSENHAGVEATKSSVGPAIAGGEDLKAAVPDGQRFGPGMADGTSTRDVFGVSEDGTARLGSLALDGVASSAKGEFDLEGFNQYAIAEGGIGAYTSDWGEVSRARSTCGTDTDREAPCSSETEEVVIKDGVVAGESDEPGSGAIPADTVVLIGREGGDDELEQLEAGDQVTVRHQLTQGGGAAFRFAVGGAPILRDGAPLSDVDNSTLAPRTSAGVSADGKTVYLTAVDGRSSDSVGMSLRELADLLREFGADDAVNLDGGGSTTLVARESGADNVTVRNAPSDGAERAVANGIGVFSAR